MTLNLTCSALILIAFPFLNQTVGGFCQAFGQRDARGTSATAGQPSRELRDTSVVAGRQLSRWFDRTPSVFGGGVSPQAVEDFTMVYDPRQHRLITFGGKTDENVNVNETWALDLETELWSNITPDSVNPPPSEDHVAIYDPIGYRVIIHGGEDGKTRNEVWSFDLENHRWHDLSDSTAPYVEDHTAIYNAYSKRMVIFGGRDDFYYNFHDVWLYDLDPESFTFEKWRKLPVSEPHPGGRSDHAAVYDSLKNRMIVFGGWDKETKRFFDETWAFSFFTRSWELISPAYAHPAGRRHAVGAYDSDKNSFIMFGGESEYGYLNDVWAFDLEHDVWINLTPGPQPRIDMQISFDPKNNRLLLFGGDSKMEKKQHDIWELQIVPEFFEALIRSVTTKNE